MTAPLWPRGAGPRKFTPVPTTTNRRRRTLRPARLHRVEITAWPPCPAPLAPHEERRCRQQDTAFHQEICSSSSRPRASSTDRESVQGRDYIGTTQPNAPLTGVRTGTTLTPPTPDTTPPTPDMTPPSPDMTLPTPDPAVMQPASSPSSNTTNNIPLRPSHNIGPSTSPSPAQVTILPTPTPPPTHLDLNTTWLHPPKQRPSNPLDLPKFLRGDRAPIRFTRCKEKRGWRPDKL